MSNRNKLTHLVLSAAIATAASGAALAQASGTQAASANAQAAQGGQAAHTMATPETVFNAWDKDKNKTLSLEEFRTGWTEIQMRQTVAKLHANFVAMDANKSNALEANEFASLEVIKKAGAKAPMMSAFDTDKNGKLDFKEYVQMIGTMMKNK
jgi:Ca2+-binding EF-hand superfamily protein